MARFSDEFLAELKMKNDIEQIISGYTTLKRRGKNLIGLCPFHNEKTPSFTVYPENQSFYCFGCGAGGEVISFIKRIENLDFSEAVRFLCDKSGMLMPSEGYDNGIAEKRRRMYEINREAAKFFHDCLLSPNGKAGLDYYVGRGFTQKTITRFGLGYAPDSWDSLLRYMREKGYSYEELYEANLANRSTKNEKIRYFDNFRNRVMVPIIDSRGNVVAFGGRVLDDSKPKYINTSDTLVYKKSLGVFGLNFAKNSKEKSLILVEGYMDAISLHQAGFDNAIACLGTALTSEMAHLLTRYADEIILSYDGDEAGQKATQKAIDVFTSIGAKLRVAKMSGGKDPDEILRKFGPERYRSLIDGSANDIEFALLKAKDSLDLESSDGKLKYLNLAAEILSTLSNSIATDIYASRLSEELNVEKQAIITRIEEIKKRKAYISEKQNFQKMTRNSVSQASKAALSTGTSYKALKAEERIISLLYANPDFISLVKDGLTEESFGDTSNGRLFSVLKERIESGGSLDYNCFASELTVDEMSRFIGLCRNSEQFSGTKKEFSDCVKVINDENEKKQKKDISVSQMSDEEFKKLFKKK